MAFFPCFMILRTFIISMHAGWLAGRHASCSISPKFTPRGTSSLLLCDRWYNFVLTKVFVTQFSSLLLICIVLRIYGSVKVVFLYTYLLYVEISTCIKFEWMNIFKSRGTGHRPVHFLISFIARPQIKIFILQAKDSFTCHFFIANYNHQSFRNDHYSIKTQ